MRVALMTDSHDNLAKLHEAVQWCNGNQIDYVLHAGDLVAPFVNKALKNLNVPFTLVFGNNDGERIGLKNMFKDRIFDPPYELTLDGKKVVMLHDPIVLDALIQSNRYDLILYGHTHDIDIRKQKPLVVNPGELGGWLTNKSTMAVWDTLTDEIELVEI